MEEIVRTTKNHTHVVATHIFVSTRCELTYIEAIGMDGTSAT